MTNNGPTSSVSQHPAPGLGIKPVRTQAEMPAEVTAALTTIPRAIPPKYFYDERGSRLFDRICGTREYYLTRIETVLLSNYATDIIATCLPAQVLELGSGISRKVRLLLDACACLKHVCEYAPFDVCEEMVDLATNQLATDFPWLSIKPLLGDYHNGLGNLPAVSGVRLLAFLGSSIGNFTATAGRDFVHDVRMSLRHGDYFLLGADRVKPIEILNAAYNDADGITAEFNLNILRVVNLELNANFQPGNFSHEAFYNAAMGQIEMYLIANCAQEVYLGKTGTVIKLAVGEKILTEISRKYTIDELESMLLENGFRIARHYQPANQWYSLILAEVRD